MRSPQERIVSAFLDKFVRQEPAPPYVRDLLKSGPAKEVLEWTFADFVSAITSADISTLNEHWMPQYRHLIDGVAYDLIPIDCLARHERLRSLYGDLSVKVGQHGLRYGDDDLRADILPVRELKARLQERGSVMRWQAFMNSDLSSRLSEIYSRDVELFEKARAAYPA